MKNLVEKIISYPEFQEFEKTVEPYRDIVILENLRKRLNKNGDKDVVEVLSWEIQAHYLTLQSSRPNDKQTLNVFGPVSERRDQEGKLIKFPDFESFSKQMVAYFKVRVQNTSNSIFKARFADIVWIKEKDYKMAENAIQAYLECAEKALEGGTYRDFWLYYNRAVCLSIEINSVIWLEKLYEKSKAFLGELESKENYRWLVEILKALVEFPTNKINIDLGLVIEFAERGYKWVLDKQAGNDAIAVDFLKIKEAVYKKQGDIIKARECRVEEANYYERGGRSAIETKQYMKASHFLNICLQKFISLGDNSEKINELKKLLKECNENSMKYESSTITTKIEIPKEQIENLLNLLSEKSIQEILTFVAFHDDFLCSIPRAKKEAEETIASAPLQYLIDGVVQDRLGNIIEILDSPEKKFKKTLYDLLDFHYVLLATYYLIPIFDLLQGKKECDAVSMKNFFSQYDFFDNDNLLFLENGFKKYLEGDYVASIHILTFRFEAILRGVLYSLGVATSSTREGKTQEKPLDVILSEEKIRAGLGEDIVTFLDWFLIDKLGFNLRHKVAHSLLEYEHFRKDTNLLVIYTLLLFTRFSLKR